MTTTCIPVPTVVPPTRLHHAARLLGAVAAAAALVTAVTFMAVRASSSPAGEGFQVAPGLFAGAWPGPPASVQVVAGMHADNLDPTAQPLDPGAACPPVNQGHP